MKRTLPPYCYRKGRKGYIYYSRAGVLVRLPDDPTSAEFARQYALARNGRFSRPARRTIKGLIAAYVSSDRWPALSPNTRKSYSKSFRYIEEKLGRFDPAAIRRVHVIEMQTALSDTPTTANRRVGALSVLFEHAINMDWIKVNPAKGVRSLEGRRAPRQPWPVEMIEAFRAAADPDTLLLFEMLLGTGQRIGDVLAMQWGHIEDGGIWVYPAKTRKAKRTRKLFVPFTSHLAAVLDATPRRGLHIVTHANGRPVSYSLGWRWIRDVRGKIGAEAWDIHALRHSAASEIASIPGMTREHVAAITGHTSAGMVHLYAGGAMQKARAIEAQAGRNTSRPERES